MVPLPLLQPLPLGPSAPLLPAPLPRPLSAPLGPSHPCPVARILPVAVHSAPASFASHRGGVHSQLSCCSEMWRQLLRDSETSVPGPRGKKGSENGREEGERGREAGGRGRPGGSHTPRQPQHQRVSGRKHWDSVNFLLSILSLIPLLSKRRGAARGHRTGNRRGR